MRVTKYVRSDGENWMLLQIRCSAHVSYKRLDELLNANGWIHWSKVKPHFDKLRKKIAAGNPTKFPNWKEVEIPMRKATKADLPAPLLKEQEAKLEVLEQDIPFTEEDVRQVNKLAAHAENYKTGPQSMLDSFASSRKKEGSS